MILSDLTELSRLLPDAPALAAALANLARGDPDGLDAYLFRVERDVPIDNTKTVANFYSVQADGIGRIRTNAFIERICTHIVDFAIPRSKIREASDSFARTGSSQKWLRLAQEAKKLFVDLSTTGEGGELLLFVLAEHVLRLPQIICKMSLKTSGHVHYHGSDGVHASIDPATSILSLYWGESKMYADPVRAIKDCLESLAPYLKGENGRDERDLTLLSSFVDLDDPKLEASLKSYLDPDNPSFNNVKYCGLAFVGFDSDSYPAETERAVSEQIAEAVRAAVRDWCTQVERRVTATQLELHDIHIILIPFPSVQAFRDRFLQQLGLQHVTA